MTGEGRHPDQVPLRDLPVDLPMRTVGAPVRRLDGALPVRAWVLLDGEASAYSPRAGHVRYLDEHGRQGSVWVWASAISRRWPLTAAAAGRRASRQATGAPTPAAG